MSHERLRGKLKQFYRKSRSRFLFLLFGIPMTIFMVLVCFSYFVFATVMIFVPLAALALAMLPRAIKTRKWYTYLLKIDFIFLFVYAGLVPNPAYWGSQVARRLDHQLLITPDEPMVQALNGTGELWDYIDAHWSKTPGEFFNETIDYQARRIYWYVQSLISYEYDIDNNWVFDYAATPKEVLTAGQDDCQGISCTTVSLLIYLGFEAYVCEIPFHWYIRVYYTNETDGQRTFIDLYRSSDDPDPFYIFNATHAWYPEDFFTTVDMAFGYDYIPRKYEEIVGENLDLSVISDNLPETDIPSQVTWSIILVFCVVLGSFMALFSTIPNNRKEKWYRTLVSTMSNSAFLFLGFYSITFVPFSSFLYFALITVCLGVFVADTGIFYHGIKRLVQISKDKTQRN